MTTPANKGAAVFASHFAASESPLKKYMDKLLFVVGSTFPGIHKDHKKWRYLYIVQSATEKDGKVSSLDIA